MAEQLIQDWLDVVQGGDHATVEEERVVSGLAGSLDDGTLTFPQFIQSITTRVEQEPDLTIAGRGLNLLPLVFVTIQNEPTRNDIHAFVPYLCARLQDASPGIYYISETLSIMAKWKRFLPGDAQEVLRAVYVLGGSNNFSSQTVTTRLSLYTLVDVLRTTHTSALKRDMSEKEVVNGVVTMAELEKNPSCLRALFGLYIDLSREWALDDDDYKAVFDSYIRYFPVTMKDAPKDPKIPSTAELRDLLLKCFVSSDGYSKMTFDAMIERLDVDSANTKVEVFRTLISAVQSFSVPVVFSLASKLWESLKFEIWNGENDQWIQSSLDVLRETTRSLDRTPTDFSDKENPVYKFVIGALAECRDRIKDKPNTYLGSSGRIFNALASANSYSFYLVSRTVVPIMDTMAQAHARGPERTRVLEVLNGILRARLVQADVITSSQSDVPTESPETLEDRKKNQDQMSNSFSAFRDRIVEIYHEGISQIVGSTDPSEDLSHCVPAIKGLELIFKVPSYLSVAERGMIVGELVQVALQPNQKDEVREESLTALGTISGSDASLFQNIVLPAAFAMLPGKISFEESKNEDELSLIVSILDYLVRISSSPTSDLASRAANFKAMEETLLKRFVDTLSYPGQLAYQHAILASISAWFEASSSDEVKAAKIDVPSTNEAQFNPILFLLSNIVKFSSTFGRVLIGGTVEDPLVRFVGEYIMRSLRQDTGSSASNPLVQWDATHPESPSAVWSLFTSADGPKFAITQSHLLGSPDEQWLANALSMYLVAGTRREDLNALTVKFNPRKAAATMILNTITPNAQSSRFSRLSALHFLQLLVNKFGAAKGFIEDYDTTLVDIMRSNIEKLPSKTKAAALTTYQTLAYFTAASLACLDPSATILLQYMLDGLQHPKYGRKVAQSFRLLLAPSDILNKENSCLIRPLRKGRLYQIVVNPLTTTWRSSQDPALKENSLIALTGVLAFLEPSMLSDNAKDILPVLLEGTNIQGDQFAKSASIKGILDLMSLVPSIIEEHLAAVIERMTDRTHNTYDSPSDSNVKCRAMALEVLAKLTEVVNPGPLLKRKAGLMKELDIALEDCSSEVRGKAERCKMAWFNLVDGE